MEEDTLDAAHDSQLDLFGLDRIRLGEGYAALARLDLDRAASIFNGLTIENPDFTDAKEGFAMGAAWGDILWELENRSPQDALVFLWEKIQSYDFGQWGSGLRKALIKRLIGMIGDDNQFSVLPNLCLGFLHAELGEYERAENAYRHLLERHPDDMKILCRLANSLFCLKKRSEARHCYTHALLSAPAQVEACDLEDMEVGRIVKECGSVMAPVYGWLRDILPLIDTGDIRPNGPEHQKAVIIYRIITAAEEARRKGDHRIMVEQRRILKETSPEVFEEYLEMLRIGPAK